MRPIASIVKMSDFNVHTDVQDVSWYSSTTHGTGGGYSAGNYAPPTAAFENFEEEAPLLEGNSH